MTNYFTTSDGKAILDIEIIPQSLPNTKKFSNVKPFKLSDRVSESQLAKEAGCGPVKVYAFRIVYTAGFAIPLSQFILSSDRREELEQFKEGVTVRITYGDPSGNMDTFDFQTVGKHIKSSPSKDMFILTWGGAMIAGTSVFQQEKIKTRFSKEMLGIAFLQSAITGKASYSGPALDVLKEAWQEICGTPVKIDDSITETVSSSRVYRVWKNLTPQNFLVDVFLHVDIRPSFPMAYIDKTCSLVVKDFQKLKMAGPTAIFVPNRQTYDLSKEQKSISNVITYTGQPEPINHRTYVNRGFGYSEISARDVKNGNYVKFSTDVGDKSEPTPTPTQDDSVSSSGIISGEIMRQLGSSLFNFSFGDTGKGESISNTCANSASACSDKQQNIKSLADQVTINTNTPKAFHESCRYNIKNLANMSAIQLRVRIPDKYLNQIQVLDYVEVVGGYKNDRISGNWIVEAIEHGFVDGNTANVVYLCRDYLDNEENANSAGSFADSIWNSLCLSSKQKETLTNICYNARTALTVCKGILDQRYLREFQAHLINMKMSTLSNFNLFGNSINLSSAINMTTSLRNTTQSLLIKLVRAFFKDPFASFIINLLFGSATILSFILLMLSSIFGAALFSALSMLIGDLKTFDTFLNNYSSALKSASQEAKPNYTTAIIAGVLTFQETPAGVLSEILTQKDLTTPTRLTMIKQTPEEILSDLKQDIVGEIIDRIPEEVDIPIPEINLTEEDLYKDRSEVVDKIIEDITNNLVYRGYVTNNTSSDESGTAIAEDGTVKVTSEKMTELLAGKAGFSSQLSKVLNNTVGDSIKVRHWGTFTTYDDLSSFNINTSYVDKYKTVNAMKSLTCRGQRVFVALPASETDVKFYINSERSTDMETHVMDVDDLGYTDNHGRPIPYVIYYSTEYYDTVNLTLEMRK